ncbi:hypothetical protein ACVWWN_000307 [Mycobacterium sp. URHB0021]
MLLQCLLKPPWVHAVRDLPMVVVIRIEVDRHGARQHKSRERGFVAIARHDQFLSRTHRGHHCYVNVLRAAVRREQRLLGPDRIGEQLHRGGFDLPGLMTGVHAIVHPDVGSKRIHAGPASGHRFSPSSARPVRRDAQRQVTPPVELLDGLSDRRCVGFVPRRTCRALFLSLLDVFPALTVDTPRERAGVGHHGRTSRVKRRGPNSDTPRWRRIT